MPHWSKSPVWGQKRRYELQDLMVLLRMAFSEPHSGAWGTVVYDIDKDFSADITDFNLQPDTPEPDKYAVNELAVMLNISLIYVVRDLYDRGFAFPEVSYRIPVTYGMATAQLPGDFMAMESLFHQCGREKREVEPSIIKELEDSYTSGSFYTTEKYFYNYEIRGNAGEEIVSGQLDPDAVLDDEDDALKLSADEIEKVSVGDFVANETDNSSGRVTEIDETENILYLDVLEGGRTDTFEAYDFYSIQTASQHYECLRLWPQMNQMKEDMVFQGDPVGMQVKKWTYPTRLRFRIDALPSGLNPRRLRVMSAIQYDTTPEQEDPTYGSIAAGSLSEQVEVGWNEMRIYAEDDFDPAVFYHLSVITNDYDGADEGHKFEVSRAELFSAQRDNYLKSVYTRLPLPMLVPTDICELPPYLVGAVVEYAKLLGYQKLTGNPTFNTNMLSSYEYEVSKALKFLRKRGESGNSNFLKNTVSRGNRGHRGYGFHIPQGYTSLVYF